MKRKAVKKVSVASGSICFMKGATTMITDRRASSSLLLVLMILLGLGVSSARADSVMPENKVPGHVESKARRLTHDLKKQGFEVRRGYFKLWTQESCPYTAGRMGTCYANNPAAPYVISTLPAWPDEFVDPVYSNIFGPSHPGYHDVYRLRARHSSFSDNCPPRVPTSRSRPGFSRGRGLMTRTARHTRT